MTFLNRLVSYGCTKSEALRRKILTPPFPKIIPVNNLDTLGSEWGQKTYISSPDLNGSSLLSGGVGEDISFDLEFAAKYGATVILVDPVPRASRHFEGVLQSLGNARQKPYSTYGPQQDYDSYDLTKISAAQLKFVPLALFDSEGELEIYPPVNPAHVNYSALDIQDKMSRRRAPLVVKKTTIPKLVTELGITNLRIVKLDIEGSQLETLAQMFIEKLFPQQILVEVDELYFPTWRGRSRAIKCFRLLKRHGYICVSRHQYDFTYVLKSKITGV